MPYSLPPQIGEYRDRALAERRRAIAAAELAEKYEGRAAAGDGRLGPVYRRMGVLHRQMQLRHSAAALLHETLSAQTERAASRGDRTACGLVEAAAETLHVRGVSAGLHSQRDRALVIAAVSDPTAHSAYFLEGRTGEGPASAAVSLGVTVAAAGPQLRARWQRYGPAAAALGIHSVIAVPLQLPAVRIGALCCYDVTGDLRPGVAAEAEAIAEVLAPLLLRAVPEASLPALMSP